MIANVEDLNYPSLEPTARRQRRTTRMKAHPGDNFFTFENNITGVLFLQGGVLSNLPRAISTTREPRRWGVYQRGGVITEQCLLTSSNTFGQMT